MNFRAETPSFLPPPRHAGDSAVSRDSLGLSATSLGLSPEESSGRRSLGDERVDQAMALSSRLGMMVRDRDGKKVDVPTTPSTGRGSIEPTKVGADAGEWRNSAASTAATSSVRDYRSSVYSVGSSSNASSYSNQYKSSSRHAEEDLDWGEVRLGDLIRPHVRYAHCTDDVHLLASFLELSQLSHIHGASVKLLFRTLWFLRLCDYSSEDICSVLVHASAYFVDAYALCGSDMDSGEVGNVLATLMFIAHCYVQDETCPLAVWHKHLFRKYCSLKTLNAAVMRLIEIRKYILRLPDAEQQSRHERLVARLPRHCQRTLGNHSMVT